MPSSIVDSIECQRNESTLSTDSESENEEVSSSKCSSSSDSDSDDNTSTVQPCSARIYNLPRARGVLLQHRINTSAASRKAIKDSGQVMDEDFFSFTPEEDKKIRENWERFAKAQNFTGHIFEFIGADKHGLTLTKNKNVSGRVFNNVMWPALCFGLDNRYAKLVKERISYIYHPHFREKEDYNVPEIFGRLAIKETILEIAEALSIPPRYVKRTIIRGQLHPEIGVKANDKVKVLKILYESVVFNAQTTYSSSNFDWKLFRIKCRENSVDPPKPVTVNRTYQTMFGKAEKQIFQYLNPSPSFQDKLLFFYECYARFVAKNRKGRKSDVPQVSNLALFTVVFEVYNKNGHWDPPAELQKYARQVNLEEVRARVRNVKERRIRMRKSKASKFDIVSKRVKLELEDESLNSTNGLEISSIHGDLVAEDLGDASTDIVFSNAYTSSIPNETILAGGGVGEAVQKYDPEDPPLPRNSDKSQIQEEPPELDMSRDIWSQIVSWAKN